MESRNAPDADPHQRGTKLTLAVGPCNAHVHLLKWFNGFIKDLQSLPGCQNTHVQISHSINYA